MARTIASQAAHCVVLTSLVACWQHHEQEKDSSDHHEIQTFRGTAFESIP